MDNITFERINPELLYGTISTDTTTSLQTAFEDIIIKCCDYLYDTSADAIASRAIHWLASTDFYYAPASTKYHDSTDGGLVRHTLKVVDQVIQLSQLDVFKGVNLAEAVLAAMCHDFCKINFYEPYMRNVKDETTGVWSQVRSWRCKGSELPFGHGVTSMYMASKLFKLTTEQALAIRWHMDTYNVCENETHDLMDSKEKFPMVRLIQMADQLAIV